MIIQFNEQQLNILNAALIEMPYRLSAPLISHINKQIQEQLNSNQDNRTVFEPKNVYSENKV